MAALNGRDGMNKGVIYVATGRDYIALAVASAQSLRSVEPEIAIDLFTSDLDAPGLGVFDQVHPVPIDHARAKLECMALSRFERTLFLDADTRVVGPLGDVFDILERFDCAMAHDVRRASDLIQEGHVPTPYAFPQLNSGVVFYRRSAAMLAFLGEWARRYHASGDGRDQIALKDLLWESDLRFYVLPPEFNLRRMPMLDAWEPLDARPTILHSHRLMDHMRGAGPQISDVDVLIKAERAALKAEWAEVEAGSDPIGRFAAAQAQLKG